MERRSPRVRAFLVHAAISVCLLLPVVLLVTLVWFPAPFLETQSTMLILGMLAVAHFVLGPVLTFTVFKPGKKGLVFDLVVIAILQQSALLAGAVMIHSERPSYVVFAVDRYVVLAEKDVDFEAAGMTGFPSDSGEQPVYAFAEMPMGKAFQELMESTVIQGQPDLERRPEFWVPLDDARDAIVAASRPVGKLATERPGVSDALKAGVSALGLPWEQASYIPVVGKRDVFVGVLAPDSGRILGVVAVDPWAE